MVEKGVFGPLNYRRLKAEIRHLELENEKAEFELGKLKQDFAEPASAPSSGHALPDLNDIVHVRDEAWHYLNQVSNRLERSPVRIEDISVRIIREPRRKRKEKE